EHGVELASVRVEADVAGHGRRPAVPDGRRSARDERLARLDRRSDVRPEHVSACALEERGVREVVVLRVDEPLEPEAPGGSVVAVDGDPELRTGRDVED